MENKQGDNTYYPPEWFTYYSFEDLPSDEIGFYLALNFNGDINLGEKGSDTTEAWSWLSQKCGFDVNRERAINNSIKQYEFLGGSDNIDIAYARLIVESTNPFNKLHIYNWDQALLCHTKGTCENSNNRWPSELMSIKPISPQRGGSWWFYNKSSDGDLIDSESNEHFFFLGK